MDLHSELLGTGENLSSSENLSDPLYLVQVGNNTGESGGSDYARAAHFRMEQGNIP